MCYSDYVFVCVRGRRTVDSWLGLYLIHQEHYQQVLAGKARGSYIPVCSMERPERSKIVRSQLYYTGEDRLYTGNNTHKHGNKEDRIQWSMHWSSRGACSPRGFEFTWWKLHSPVKPTHFYREKTKQTFKIKVFFFIVMNIWQSLVVKTSPQPPFNTVWYNKVWPSKLFTKLFTPASLFILYLHYINIKKNISAPQRSNL